VDRRDVTVSSAVTFIQMSMPPSLKVSDDNSEMPGVLLTKTSDQAR
jgi:hypothetical protein